MWWGDDTKPWYGMPDDEVMETMGSRQQPGMSGRGLYQKPGDDGTVDMDRKLGDRPTDPQSGWERNDHDRRVAGTGVSAGMTHDHFNERGLTVRNDRGDEVQVGG